MIGNQLLGTEWSLGLTYRLTQPTLERAYAEIPNPVADAAGLHRTERTLLHNVVAFLQYNHESGLFGLTEVSFYDQTNWGYRDDEPESEGQSFWQWNFLVGYRFPHSTGRATIGVLNLTDQDYHLNPLSALAELPRERTFIVQLDLSF